ncbi:MAG: hypothetical protein ACOCXQ_01660 [Patescibacteria group bacterium]
MARITNHSQESGQILLLLVMVMGTLMIVAMTAIFQSTSETQISGSNQSAQRTLSAAEAGLEVALLNPELVTQSTTFEELGLSTLAGISLTESRVNVEEKRQSSFTIPKLSENEQYTFYLSEYSYDTDTGTASWENPYGGEFLLYYTSNNTETNTVCEDISLELSLIYDVNTLDDEYQVKTFIADAGDQIDNTGDETVPATTTDDDLYIIPSYLDGDVGQPEVEGVGYNCLTHSLDTRDYPNPRVLLIKALLSDTSVALQTQLSGGGLDNTLTFPPQGRTITSTARSATDDGATATGVTKTAVIFQSFPQLSEEMFTTSF